VLGPFGDAIDFIFQPRESQAGTVQVGGLGEMSELTLKHLELSFTATLTPTLIAMPIGASLGHTGRHQFLAISTSNIGRAVPSLGLIVFFIAFLGVGFLNVCLALVLLAIPPIITNTYAGWRVPTKANGGLLCFAHCRHSAARAAGCSCPAKAKAGASHRCGMAPETTVPTPAFESIDTRPPSSTIRSRMCCSPLPDFAVATSKPGPSSDTSNPTLCASSCKAITMFTEGPPCLAAFWIASRQQ
jgi:hypothetical protein